MKRKILIIILIILIILGIILGIKIFTKTKEDNKEEIFRKNALSYYNAYMANIKGTSEAKITLEMLENAVKEKDEDYNIETLKKCNKKSSITFVIENDKIISNKIELSC